MKIKKKKFNDSFTKFLQKEASKIDKVVRQEAEKRWDSWVKALEPGMWK